MRVFINFFCLGNLKITDFGLSTVFRYKEKERMLERCCGTPPYVAPEVSKHKSLHEISYSLNEGPII